MAGISSLFSVSGKPTNTHAKHVYQQQAGVGIRLYPNGNDGREVRDLFWEVTACTTDRTITEVGGSFNFTLNASEPWDELIQPDDFVRIFMGDQIATLSADGELAYNFATSSLKQSANESGDIAATEPAGDVGKVFVPLPNLGPLVSGNVTIPGQGRKMNVLVMQERFIGKVDRISRTKSPGNKDQGYTASFQVSGRSLGAIIQDISLYYNPYIDGMNAISIFAGTDLKLIGSATDLVKQILVICLTSVPFPQWKLPQKLIDDLDLDGVLQENTELAQERLDEFNKKIASSRGNKTPPSGSAFSKLQALAAESGSISDQSPLSVISLRSLYQTYGGNFFKNFLNSSTSGLFDMIRNLQNPGFNEFFFDLCPNGDVEGGRNGRDGLPAPSFCMRQRPLDITSEMMFNVADYVKPYAAKLSDFSGSAEMQEEFGADYFELMDDGNDIMVYGPMAFPTFESDTGSDIDKYIETEATPMLLDYEVGLSNADRQNGWMVIGKYDANDDRRLLVTSLGGFHIDVDSAKTYGFRMVELSTNYVEPSPNKEQPESADRFAVEFGKTLANWYFMNPAFLNGRLVCRFLKEARLGIVCKYLETRITPENPYPKLELFYVQGVADDWSIGQPIRTTLTVVRGIRYKLTGVSNEEEITSAQSAADISAQFGTIA